MSRDESSPFSCKTVIVTGSAKGIGAGIIREFASLGANCVINYRWSESEAFALHKEIESGGGKALTFGADLADESSADSLMKMAVDRYGSIDILVNNAGDFLYKSISETTSEEWKHIIDSNLNSTFFCTRAALPYMRAAKSGRIINIGDMRLEQSIPQPMKTPYVIAKSGILQLTRSLAATETQHGITVNAVSPGYIDAGNYSDSFKERVLDAIPAGRLGTPKDIAEAVIFLSSSKAAYISGANLEVTGGVYSTPM